MPESPTGRCGQNSSKRNFEGEIISDSVSLDDLISGQAATRWKCEILSCRLHLLTERGEVVPKKRVSASEGSGLPYREQEKCISVLLFCRRMGRICLAEYVMLRGIQASKRQ